MMRILWIILLYIFLFSGAIHHIPVKAATSCANDDPCKSVDDIFQKVTCYTDVVNVCATQRQSMTAQVSYLTNKIELTTAKIAAAKKKISDLENEIEDLTEKISKLENSLTDITEMFIDRIVATYKYSDISIAEIFLTSHKFTDLINRYKYIQTVQTHDRRLLFQIQNSKVNFEDQKVLRETKKKELDAARLQLEKEEVALVVQKKEKELFLETTRNSEAKYRQELGAAKREAEGIQKAASLLSSAGVPKHVGRGETVGIMGNTGFSTGEHLHFAVYNLKESELGKFNFSSGYENPFSLLTSRSVPFDPTSCDDVSTSSKTTKSIGGGSWEWPMANPTISQCYGHTPWSWRYQSSIHNGVDMWDDNNKLVRAAESGNAYWYRGGQAIGNGVFIFHSNGKMTLYWHLAN